MIIKFSSEYLIISTAKDLFQFISCNNEISYEMQ